MRLRIKFDVTDATDKHTGQQYITAALNAVDTAKPRRQIVTAGRTGTSFAIRRDNKQSCQHHDTRTNKGIHILAVHHINPFALETMLHNLQLPLAVLHREAYVLADDTPVAYRFGWVCETSAMNASGVRHLSVIHLSCNEATHATPVG